jgi:hypothetical protein
MHENDMHEVGRLGGSQITVIGYWIIDPSRPDFGAEPTREPLGLFISIHTPLKLP